MKLTNKPIAIGIAVGFLVELLSLVVAFLSTGAGHGDYGAARTLFPLPMLTTLIEGQIGAFAFGLALLQFPLYGAILGWAVARSNLIMAVALVVMHSIAVIVSFSGILPNFS
jgi:hypothetical protein